MTYNSNDFSPAANKEIESDGTLIFKENAQGIILSNSARTSTTVSQTFQNFKYRGIIIYLDVTAASGTGGLQIQIRTTDPQNNDTYQLNATPVAVTGITRNLYVLYPGAAGTQGSITQSTNAPLPRNWYIQIVHGDSTSYTYSLSYSLNL